MPTEIGEQVRNSQFYRLQDSTYSTPAPCHNFFRRQQSASVLVSFHLTGLEGMRSRVMDLTTSCDGLKALCCRHELGRPASISEHWEQQSSFIEQRADPPKDASSFCHVRQVCSSLESQKSPMSSEESHNVSINLHTLSQQHVPSSTTTHGPRRSGSNFRFY